MHLFETGTLREIILAISLITSSQNAAKTSSVQQSLNLNHYLEIQMMTKGKCYNNANLEKCKREMPQNNKISGNIQYISFLQNLIK